ncbi:MAG: nitric-oxide reductase large subunit, partial [Gammaproteobacteria bacterium]|nr:nitric-oxide reductase large subunit [Gammaproteobacteria bacterium]
DVLHREAQYLADRGGPLDELSEPEQAKRIAEVSLEIRLNTYDERTKLITVSPVRSEAIESVIQHYDMLFSESAEGEELREAYAIPNSMLSHITSDDVRALTAWWWWTAWAAGTNRPGLDITYTSNWPHEPLIQNTPTTAAFIWTFVSITLLIAGVGLLCWFFLREREEWVRDSRPVEGFGGSNPLDTVQPTASMTAVKKYFWVVAGLLGLQIILGAVTAHYRVEGHDFYGLPLSEIAPYALTRTWHVQLAVLWIATAWLGAGLYLGPLIARKEPKFQVLGVNLLWGALVGSLVGEALVLNGVMTDPTMVYWFGHQGYEYLDMGRFWQILIFAGLLIWLVLMARCVIPAIQEKRPDRSLLIILLLATAGSHFCLVLGYCMTGRAI